MLIRWRYVCQAADDFERIDATVLFDVLPSLTTLDTQFFDGTRAGAATLTRESRVFVID